MTISSGAISDLNGMLPAMKITEPYSPTPRAKASAKPVSERRARSPAGDHARNVCSRVAPSVSAASSTSLEQLGEHRLDRSHDEGQADEDQRDHDAQRRVGDLACPAASSSRPIQPVSA